MNINTSHNALAFRRSAKIPEKLLRGEIRFTPKTQSEVDSIDNSESPYLVYQNRNCTDTFTVPKVTRVTTTTTEYTLNKQGMVKKETSKDSHLEIQIKDTNPENKHPITRHPDGFLKPLTPDLFDVVEEKNGYTPTDVLI
jgi:hypothetical protein